MENRTPREKAKSAVVRAEFDKILMHHVSSLLDTREDIAALPFNLVTISSLLLLADREHEIKTFPESPPDRYNQETFLADIKEIGFDLDKDAISAIRDLEHYGFLVINPQFQYHTRESASLLITVLDAIFPQMPGMNLVAYLSQAIEEVLSGRKERDRALSQFDQTLHKQGVRLSAIPEDSPAFSAARRITAHKAPDPEVLLARRAAYLQKLRALRAKSLSSGTAPSVIAGGHQLKHVEITEIFKRKEAEPEDIPEEIPHSDTEEIPTTAAFSDESPTNAVLPETETELYPSVPESLPEFHEESVEAEMAGMRPGPAGLENAIADKPEAVRADVGEMDDVGESLSKVERIEQQIRQFEEELAMPCPVCSIGKVLSDATEKGKTYYHCSNEDCRLISWGKPYHMECPVCKNPFLVEVPERDGQIGLKCPRASCLYRKKNAVGVPAEEKSVSGKRKVAVVKKKRKKAVRRLVRRKSR